MEINQKNKVKKIIKLKITRNVADQIFDLIYVN